MESGPFGQSRDTARAMSEENIEFVRTSFERWNRGDREIPADEVDQSFELHSKMLGRVLRGREGLQTWFLEIDQQFEEWRLEIAEFREADHGRLLVLGQIHLRGTGSKVEFDQPMAWLLDFRSGKVIRMEMFTHRLEALEAAGLSEQAMSEENKELIRRGIEAFNRRDVEGLQAICTTDFELVPLRAAMEGTTYSGPDAIAAAFQDFDESWEDLRYEVDDIRAAGNRVVAITRLRGRGRQSGAGIDQAVALVFCVRDGKAASMRSYTDLDEALEAAGLSE
jgi:ketosteroid isomerase-like protein